MQDNVKAAKVDGLTPSQTVGPYFAYGLTPGGQYAWNDAFSGNLVTSDVTGERIRIEGRVFDGDGAAVPDCMLEIWQADGQGRFADPQDKRALPNSSAASPTVIAPRLAICRRSASSCSPIVAAGGVICLHVSSPRNHSR